MSTGEFNAGGDPAMVYHPIQGGIEILLGSSCYGTGIRADLMGRLAQVPRGLSFVNPRMFINYIRILYTSMQTVQ